MAAMKFRGRYIISIIDLSAGEAVKASSGLFTSLLVTADAVVRC